MKTCEVCCEYFKKCITCTHCGYITCKTCTSRYLLTIDKDPQCMRCNKPWELDFLLQVFTKQFVNDDLKKHRREILFQRESIQFESTQQYAEKEKQKRNAIEFLECLKKERVTLMQQTRKLDNNIAEVRNQILTGQFESPDIYERIEYISRKCPHDNCRGFMKCVSIQTVMTCGLCNNEYCRYCNEKHSEDHQCDEDTKNTLNYILNSSKNCPSCGVSIQKSSGCDQMWCTQCHTTFSYKTGRIETGRTHNPLYLEWLRANGRNSRDQDDYACGGLPSKYDIHMMVLRCFGYTKTTVLTTDSRTNVYKYCSLHGRTPRSGKIDELLNLAANSQRLFGFKYRIDNRLNNRNLTIKYLLHEINEELYKKRLYEHEKFFQKNRDIGYCLHFLSHGLTDILQRSLLCMCEGDIVNILHESDSFIKYYNKEISKVSFRYGKMVVPFIRNTQYGQELVNNRI